MPLKVRRGFTFQSFSRILEKPGSEREPYNIAKKLLPDKTILVNGTNGSIMTLNVANILVARRVGELFIVKSVDGSLIPFNKDFGYHIYTKPKKYNHIY
jgi:hypothetical protein